MNAPGLLLAGRYRLLHVLGEGGMAVVHRAVDELLDREVAVKVLREQYAADPDFVARFRQEARNAAALTHPNIAAVFDTGVDGPVEYIVMQLVDGPDLEAVLTERGRLSVAEALRIAVSTAEALEAAHARGIVHRDIKPGNILLTAERDVRVVDFGIARALGDARTTNPGLLLGSVQYCSPEQVLGEPIGPATDIYSLGIVLHELLTGTRPWDGPSAAAVALARLHEPPPPPTRIVTDLPPGVDALVDRALQRDPARRYPSAAAMAAAIREWWRGHRTTAAPVDPRRAAARRRGATGALPIGAAATGASALTIAGLGSMGAGSASPLGAGTPAAAGPGDTVPHAGARTVAERMDVTRPGEAPGHGAAPDPRPDADDRRRRPAVPLWALAFAAIAVLAVGLALVVPDRFGSSVLDAVATPTASVPLVAVPPETTPPTSATPQPTPPPTPTPAP
ncbi:MAG TPA: protein kinase, partial [Vitreimonas sp.]|nr:protein kinase [Vitreimonas sp.]